LVKFFFKIPDSVKWAIVAYHKENMVYQDIARKCGVSWHCVNNTIKRFIETGDIREKKSTGCKKITSKRDNLKSIRLANSEPIGKILIYV
jgi:transposase